MTIVKEKTTMTATARPSGCIRTGMFGERISIGQGFNNVFSRDAERRPVFDGMDDVEFEVRE